MTRWDHFAHPITGILLLYFIYYTYVVGNDGWELYNTSMAVDYTLSFEKKVFRACSLACRLSASNTGWLWANSLKALL